MSYRICTHFKGGPMTTAPARLDGARMPRSAHAFVRSLGVPDLEPHTSPFDPGYDVATVVSHLEQSAHLISRLKLSMACWLIAGEAASRAKIQAAKRLGVPLVTGGGPFEIAQDRGRLDDFMELCASLGVERIEAGEGFTSPKRTPEEVVRLAARYGLEVQAELGEKHSGSFTDPVVAELIARGRRWLAAGAKQIVVEGRESARGVGLYDEASQINFTAAEAFASAWGMESTIFEAPTKASQFAFLTHFGNRVNLSNVRLEELLRVEIYRRGLHSDAYGHMLAPLPAPAGAAS
jgi:phosphosulfolactate synthase